MNTVAHLDGIDGSEGGKKSQWTSRERSILIAKLKVGLQEY